MRRSILTKLASVVVFGGALAGCGGSTSLTSSSQTTAAQTTAVTQPATQTGTTTSPRSASATKHVSGKAKLHATVYNPKPSQPQSSEAGTVVPSSAQNPCTLVTGTEAAAILHGQILRQVEAPQGPTCVLEVNGAKQSVTLAVEPINVSRDIAHMKQKPAQLVIGGHTAYCGTLGSSLLFVELGGGKVLEVAAPCAAAEELAAKALPRIKA